MDRDINKQRHHMRDTYWSFPEFVSGASEGMSEALQVHGDSEEWCGGSWGDVARFSREGWEDGIKEATPIVESALRTIHKEREHETFQANWDKSGAEVDMGRFLADQPDCMIEYEPVTISKAGRVVTLSVNCTVSGSQEVSSMIRRGAAIAGLAMALEEAQHPVEIWLHLAVEGRKITARRGSKGAPKWNAEVRVLVKGAHDMFDAGVVMYALAHPTVLRRLMFAQMHSFPEDVKKSLSVGSGYGMPMQAEKDLPEGTLYVDHLRSGSDVRDADKFVTQTLRELGLLEG